MIILFYKFLSNKTDIFSELLPNVTDFFTEEKMDQTILPSFSFVILF